MKKATPNRFLTAGRPGVFKVKMSLGRAMKTTDLNGGLTGGVGTLGPASGVGVGAGAGICLELEPEPKISKMGGSGNPAFI